MTDKIKPVTFKWDGAAMVPLPRFNNLVNAQYVVGQNYTLAPIARSRETHNHFFACIQRAWDNLPDDIRERLPDPEALRKWALIKAGFRTERTIVAATPRQAQEIAAFARPKDYCVVIVDDCTVTIYEAKSQAELQMDRGEFQRSKEAVLDIVSRLIGVDVTTLEKQEQEHGEG